MPGNEQLQISPPLSVGSAVALTLTAMFKAGTRCLTIVRVFILAPNHSAATRPEKFVFAMTGVVRRGWFCNLNRKHKCIYHIQARIISAQWPLQAMFCNI